MSPLEALQAKKPFNAYVLGEFEQGIEMLVPAQRLAIDAQAERNEIGRVFRRWARHATGPTEREPGAIGLSS